VINFRYHLVSIAAVFLALGLGLLLGSIVLKPYVTHGLLAISKKEEQQIHGLLRVNRMLNTELTRSGQFAQAAEAQLVGHLLAGQNVVVITAPGAPGTVTTGLTAILRRAGATVTGQVQLQQPFLQGSPTARQALGEAARSQAPVAGITLRPGLTSAQAAGQVLASALLTKDGSGQPRAGQRDTASTTVLRGFMSRGLLTTATGTPPARATLAIVIIPDPPPYTGDSNHSSQALVTLAEALKTVGNGVVVAGSATGSGPGSAIDVMRTRGRATNVSSVDNADKIIGQIVTVQALREQMSGVSGSYGWLPTAAQAGPSPAPTPSPGLAAAGTTGTASGRGSRASGLPGRP
jgi:Copper transport outer membrane protein, MctB